MRHQLATLLLAPLLLWQGRATRRSTPILPEPPGARSGTLGKGPELHLLILGDSAAAGVGAPHQNSALSGSLVQALAQNYRLSWELRARTGATTASTIRHLQSLPRRPYDLVITSLGVNDVTTAVNRRSWLQQQRDLRNLLRHSFDVRLMLISGLPPIASFPALPQPLRWYLGSRARDFDRDLERDMDGEADAVFLSLRFGDVAAMALDGFHPGPTIYSEWGRRAADIVQARL